LGTQLCSGKNHYVSLETEANEMDRQALRTNDVKEILDSNDIAERLDLTVGRVYQLLAAGVIPHIRIGRAIKIPRRAFEQWLEEQSTQAWANIQPREME
jgi:excisionase family DNA binding protein